MITLWKRTFDLFRTHILLWVPCSTAGILMIALGKLRRAEIHWLFGFFGTQRSVLGGVVPTTDFSHVQHQVMMVMYPQWTLIQLFEISFFVMALVTTKNLVKMVLESQRPEMLAAVKGLASEYREILLFSLKYMAAMAFFGGILISASYVLTREQFESIALSRVSVSVYGIAGDASFAWLLVPSAIRLLRRPDIYPVSTREKQTGTIFAVAASAVTLGLGFLVGHAESALILHNQLGWDAIAAANSVIVNMPQILLFIALALMAIQTLDEGTPMAAEPEVDWGRQLSAWVRRAREWRGDVSVNLEAAPNPPKERLDSIGSVPEKQPQILRPCAPQDDNSLE